MTALVTLFVEDGCSGERVKLPPVVSGMEVVKVNPVGRPREGLLVAPTGDPRLEFADG